MSVLPSLSASLVSTCSSMLCTPRRSACDGSYGCGVLGNWRCQRPPAPERVAKKWPSLWSVLTGKPARKYECTLGSPKGAHHEPRSEAPEWKHRELHTG